MLALLDISDFRRLWLGQLTSVLGTWLLVIAIPLYVYDRTGSSAATGATFVAEVIPALALGPAAGVLVDRWDRRRVMIVSDVVRALCVLAMLLATTADRLWILYLAIVAENAAAQLFRPARQAIIPSLVGSPHRLPEANAMFAMIDGMVRLGGSVVGGMLYLTIGFRWLVVLNAVSYLVSALACRQVRYRPRQPHARPVTFAGGAADLRAGILHVLRTPPLRRLLRVTAIFYLANGAITALLVPYARGELGTGATSFGYLLAALGGGYLVGTVVAHRLIERFSPLGAVAASVPVVAAGYLLAFQPEDYSAALAGLALTGAPAVVLLVAVHTAYQQLTPDRLLGRVAAAFLTVEMAVSVLGAGVGSVLADRCGVLPVLDVALLVLGALGLSCPPRRPWRAARRGPRRLPPAPRRAPTAQALPVTGSRGR